MNINSYRIPVLSFRGIVPPYTNARGYEIIPIEENPSQKQIDKAIDITKNGKASSGMNGDAFMLGKDLVVKKYKSPKEAFNYNPEKEIKILDSMYDKKIKLNGCQRGIFAFKTPGGDFYLVSSQVPGESPNYNKQNLNRKNLKAIINIITQMDAGILEKSIPATTPEITYKLFKYTDYDLADKKRKNSFDIKRIMHYDLAPANIKVTNDNAGILDFEYTQYENINERLSFLDKNSWAKQIDTNLHLADTALLPSNIRGFEYRTLYPYLLKTDKPKELFSEYLMQKSRYHYILGYSFSRCATIADKNGDDYFSEQYEDIAQKEFVHDSLLSDPYNLDIKKAEAIKIQLAKFIDEQSPFNQHAQINPEQIAEYTDQAIDFFQKMQQYSMKHSDKEREIYYSDCLNLMQNWNGVKEWMNYQLEEPDISSPNYTQRKNNRALFISKLSDKKQITLDKIVL